MFYSHELLTSRQYGVATIWLVATLGSKSNLKKVTRKAILDVDIPKACDTITDPESPLALRLQASLLYGVSRVHSQQCNYVLTDTQSFRDKMGGIAQVMKDLEIDPEVGRTRPEQLNLAEDSAFIPELDLMFDLSAFDLPSTEPSSQGSSILSPFSRPSSQSSLHLDEDGDLALEIPSLDTPGDFGGTNFGAGVESSAGSRSVATRSIDLPLHQGSAIINDPDFEVAEDGSLVAPANIRRSEDPTRAASESGFSGRVQGEHEEGVNAAQNAAQYNQDDDLMLFGDDDEIRLPEAEPFPAVPRQDNVPSSDLPPPVSPQFAPMGSTSNASVAAPQRQIRAAKKAHADQRTELQNKDLGDWSNEYLNNMADLAKAKEQKRSTAQAKKNAAFWILGQGIGAVQVNFGDDRDPHPLAVFSGQALLDALTGPTDQHSPSGSKRTRSHSQGSEDGRRVRPRSAEPIHENARAEEDQPMLGLDDDGIMIQGDDFNPESEVGRRAGSSLPDVGSILPWNRSANASRYGSAQPFGDSGGAGISSSVGGAGSLRGPGSNAGASRGRTNSVLANFRTRLLSASPSMGRGLSGLPLRDLDDLRNLARNRPEGLLDDESVIAGMDDDFEQYGPAANVDTQTAQTSQWMRKALEDESLNFLGFVENVLQGVANDDNEIELQAGEPMDEVSMDELLPPEKNSAIVGAQALLHILTLVTKGMLAVKQEAPFGEIMLSAVAHDLVGARAADGDADDQEDVADEAEEYVTGDEGRDPAGGEENDDEEDEDEDDEL